MLRMSNVINESEQLHFVCICQECASALTMTLRNTLIDQFNNATRQATPSIARLETFCILAQTQVILAGVNDESATRNAVHVSIHQGDDFVQHIDVRNASVRRSHDVAEVAYVPLVLGLGLSMILLKIK